MDWNPTFKMVGMIWLGEYELNIYLLAEMNLIIAVVMYPYPVNPDLNLESVFLLECHKMSSILKSSDLKHLCPIYGSPKHFNNVFKMVSIFPKVEYEHKHLPPLCITNVSIWLKNTNINPINNAFDISKAIKHQGFGSKSTFDQYHHEVHEIHPIICLEYGWKELISISNTSVISKAVDH
jgi:hypothetical protein